MDIETTRATVHKLVDKVRQSAMADAMGWGLDHQDLILFVGIRSRQRKDRSFLLRVSFDDLPRRAPSYVFVNPSTKQHDDAGWPPNVRHGRAPPGICTPGTRECCEHYHVNDPQYQWRYTDDALLCTLLEIQKMVEKGVGT